VGSTAKRHHTVPQFYLRGFALDDQIGTVRLPGDVRFPQAVRKAASETHFYTVEGHPEGADAIEKSLGTIEGAVASIFEMLKSGTWPLDKQSRTTLGFSVALQSLRGPEQRKNLEFLSAQMARMEIGYGGRDSVKEWVKRHSGFVINETQAQEVWEQVIRPEGPPMKVQPIVHIRHMAEMTQELLPYIIGRPWTLVRFDRRSLITSDTPVTLVPHHTAASWEGTGFLTAWGITYPLTRKLGLLMSDPTPLIGNVPVERVWDGAMDRIEVGTTRMEKFMNGFTADSASHAIFHHPDDERFVPSELHGPAPRTLDIAGGGPTFEPWPT
jgi:hypothetical protein